MTMPAASHREGSPRAYAQHVNLGTKTRWRRGAQWLEDKVAALEPYVPSSAQLRVRLVRVFDVDERLPTCTEPYLNSAATAKLRRPCSGLLASRNGGILWAIVSCELMTADNSLETPLP
jgi:hypothetical protein